MSQSRHIPLNTEEQAKTKLSIRKAQPVKLNSGRQAATPLRAEPPKETALVCHPVTIMREGCETYAGPYTVTPSEETQVLPTQGMAMANNVTVNPIPSNYGLITWNGSTLTVS